MLVYRITDARDSKSYPLFLAIDKLGDLDAIVNPGPGYEKEFVGDKFLVEVVEMTQEQFENLGEFDGF